MKKMHFKAIELGCLDNDTAQKIRGWRNQDFVRSMSFYSNIIDEETHNKWLERMRTDPNRNLFVFYLDDQPFGIRQYTYDPEINSVCMGHYLISEDYQSLGYGTFLTFFGEEIMYYYLGYNKAHSHILKSNQKAIHTTRHIEKVERPITTINIDGTQHETIYIQEDKEEWEKERKRLIPLILHFIEPEYTICKNNNTVTGFINKEG